MPPRGCIVFPRRACRIARALIPYLINVIIYPAPARLPGRPVPANSRFEPNPLGRFFVHVRVHVCVRVRSSPAEYITCVQRKDDDVITVIIIIITKHSKSRLSVTITHVSGRFVET